MSSAGLPGLSTALLADLRAARPTLWVNPGRQPLFALEDHLRESRTEIDIAARRWQRLAPVLARCFPELGASAGVIESPLIPVPTLAARLRASGVPLARADVLVKADHALPVSGSIKARGGIHAVLAIAERLAERAGLLVGQGDDRSALLEPAAQALFTRSTISVGSTGNLGMSIGLAGRALGFRVAVHLSEDAKHWKKDRLRALGVDVIEHAGDYSLACATARSQAAADPDTHFIDDENSTDLFYGYAVAGRRLADQLQALGIHIGPQRPLIVHLPCGVGGAPGGVATGTRLALGDTALAFTAEPVQAPCMLLGLATGRHDGIAVQELGLHGRTLADGLAVARPSQFVGRLIAPLIDGCATADDGQLCSDVLALHRDHGLRLEPSATAGVTSLRLLLTSPVGQTLCSRLRATLDVDAAVHVIWATGGAQVPEAEFASILAQGAKISGTK